MFTITILIEPKHHHLVSRRAWGESASDCETLKQRGLALQGIFAWFSHFTQHEDRVTVDFTNDYSYGRVLLVFFELGGNLFRELSWRPPHRLDIADQGQRNPAVWAHRRHL